MLLACYKPHRQKPNPKRLPRSVEKRPGGSRGLRPTSRALKQAPRRGPWLSDSIAMWAPETIWPAKSRQVVPTSVLTREPSVELLERSRVINPWPGRVIAFHSQPLHLVVGGVKCIPLFGISAHTRIPSELGMRNKESRIKPLAKFEIMRVGSNPPPSPHFSPISCCEAQYTARVCAFSNCSLGVLVVRLHSQFLRERRPAQRLAPLATKIGEKSGRGFLCEGGVFPARLPPGF